MLQKDVKQDMKGWEFWGGIITLNRVVRTGLIGKMSPEVCGRSNLSCKRQCSPSRGNSQAKALRQEHTWNLKNSKKAKVVEQSEPRGEQ